MPDKPELDRRTFLRHLLALPVAGVAVSLGGCSTPAGPPAGPPAAVPPAPTAAPTSGAPAAGAPAATSAAAPTASTAPVAAPSTATAPTAAAPAAAAANAYLAVARGDAPGAAELARRAIAGLGGIERFVGRGADVIVKPNICNAYHGPEYASTTNPEVVAAIVALCLAAGAKRVRVMDFPFGGTAQNAYKTSGIAAAVEAAGGQMELMNKLKYKALEIPNAQRLRKAEVYSDILEADVLINVPIAKHHGMATLTLGLKNLMGVVRDRGAMHSAGLPQSIVDLATIVKPTLTVIDATRILVANGPTGGNLDDVRQTNTVIASADTVAADAYAATLFGKTGSDIAYIALADKLGLGTMDLKAIAIDEINA